MERLTVAEHVSERCAAARADGLRVGLVPTMGAFHDGHLSLMRRARADDDLVVVYLFLNPLQFGAGEDLSRYPHDLERDRVLAESENVDVLFTPTLEDMYPMGYPPPPAAVIHPGPVGGRLEGEARPGHFEGVLTVVDRLFDIVGPGRAYFGEKDAQQLFLVREMAEVRHPGVEVVACPTIRESDGLAMSSRNVYLSPEERAAASSLSAGLRSARRAFQDGERDAALLAEALDGPMRDQPLVVRDYATVVDPVTFEAVTRAGDQALALVAARVGSARLIDNLRLDA